MTGIKVNGIVTGDKAEGSNVPFTISAWWMPTAEALRAMCEVAGFRYEAGAPSWNGNTHTLRLSV